MDEVIKPLPQIEAEINILKTQAAQNVIEIGKAELGKSATLRQICNYVAPQIGVSSKDCFSLVTNLRVVE